MFMTTILVLSILLGLLTTTTPQPNPPIEQSITQTAEARRPSVQEYKNFEGCAFVFRTGKQWKELPSEWMVLPKGIQYHDDERNLDWGYNDQRDYGHEFADNNRDPAYHVRFCVSIDPWSIDYYYPNVINRDVKLSEDLIANLWEYVFRGAYSGGRFGDPINPEMEYYFSLLVQETYQGLGLEPPKPLPKPQSIRLSEAKTQQALTPSPTITNTPDPTHTLTLTQTSTSTPSPTSTPTIVPTFTPSPTQTETPTPKPPVPLIESLINNLGVYLAVFGLVVSISIFVYFIWKLSNR